MRSSKEINSYVQLHAIGGEKVPHSTSHIVVRKENERYYLAAFVFFFNREDIENGKVNRPSLWLIADVRTGEIIEKRETSEMDFSDASYELRYNISAEGKYDTSKEYYEKAFAILDTVRDKILEENIFDEEEYVRYLDMIVANIPSDYKRFFYDLSV